MARHSLSPLIFVVAIGLIAGSLAASAQTTALQRARELARTGNYEAALEVLPERPSPRDAVAERIARARILATIGRVGEGIELLEVVAVGRRATAEGALAYAELIVSRGRPSRAVALLDDVIERQPLLVRAYFARGLLLDRLGRSEASRADLQVLAEAYEGGHLTGADEMAMAARALHQLGRWEESNRAFAAALAVDPDAFEARLAWARLLLEKYQPTQALELTEEVLAVNPRHPRGLLLRARALYELDRAPDVVAEQARAALEVNPELPEAHELLAELAIDDEQYEEALDIVQVVLDRDEARLESLTLRATASFLLDRRRSYRRALRGTLAINPSYPEIYVTIADFAAHVFRYDDAVDLYERALAIDADHGPANLGLGIGLTRQGDDERGLVYLRRALELDPFNERAWRMVRFYDDALADYEEVTSDHFRFRFYRDERSVLETFVPPLMEASYARYLGRYGAGPAAPLAVEVFPDAETFATRSAGLPHVGPHGICFGRLITARSPSGGEINWAEVLSHELSHAFTIELSDARAPRWLAEGMAQWDTAWLRPEWQRESDFALLSRLRAAALPSVTELNRAFVRVRDLSDVRAAYAQSTLTVQFIASGWGVEAPVQMLRLFAERRRLPEVLQQVTGLDVPAFDAAFEDYLRERLGSLLPSFEPNLGEPRDEEELETLVIERPDDPDAWAELAVARLQLRRLEGCEAAVARALELDPRHPLGNFVAGFLAMRERSYDEARARFEQVLADGHDGYSLRIELAYLSRRQGRSSEALDHYEQALAIYPHDAEPWLESADIHLRADQLDRAIEALRRGLSIDQAHYEAAAQLVQLLVAEGRDAEAAEACELANHINPFDAERQGVCGRVAYRLRDWSAARRQLEAEIALGPEDQGETERLLAAVDRASGGGALPVGDPTQPDDED